MENEQNQTGSGQAELGLVEKRQLVSYSSSSHQQVTLVCHNNVAKTKIVKCVVCHRGSTLVAAILGGFGVKCLNAELSSKQARLASGSLVLMNIQIKLGFSVIKPGAQTS